MDFALSQKELRLQQEVKEFAHKELPEEWKDGIISPYCVPLTSEQ